MRIFPLVLAGLCSLSMGCRSYDHHIRSIQEHFYANDPDQAAELIEKEFEAGFWGRFSEDEHDLLRLELASALQAAGHYKRAAEQLATADENLEFLDYQTTTAADLGDFLFASGSVWRASTAERVLVNTEAMLNRLCQDTPNLSDAMVEARRFGILIDQQGLPEDEVYANDFAMALAGFCMEQGGRLSEVNDYWRDVEGANPMRRADGVEASDDTGTLLVVAQLGKAPIRREVRIVFPVDGIPYQMRIPVLVERHDTFRSARVLVDGKPAGELQPMFDLGQHLEAQYDRDKGKILAAAATQLVARSLVARSARLAAQGGSDDSGWTWLLEVATNLFLTELQPPDTRGWSLVPQRFHALRLELPVGDHDVSIVLEGDRAKNLKPRTVSITSEVPRTLNVISDKYRTWSSTPPDVPIPDVTQWQNAATAASIIRAAVHH